MIIYKNERDREGEEKGKRVDQIQRYACTRCPKMIENIIFVYLVHIYSAHIHIYFILIDYVFAKTEKIDR